MTLQLLLVRLPDELVRRFRRRVPARRRSAFVRTLLERALPPSDDESDRLYRTAIAVERDERLAVEMAEWDATIEDGLMLDALEPPPA